MVKTVAAKARKTIVRVAQRGAETIRTVAADAAGAAAQAAGPLIRRKFANMVMVAP